MTVLLALVVLALFALIGALASYASRATRDVRYHLGWADGFEYGWDAACEQRDREDDQEVMGP